MPSTAIAEPTSLAEPLSPAESYERDSVPALFAPCAERLLTITRPRPGERVLDVGCGTGVVARQAAPLVGAAGRVAGLDITPGMLAVARAVSERQGLGIEWHEGRAEALPFADGSFDLVVSQFALMFFTDRRTALSEMRRVLSEDGGRVAIHVLHAIERHPFYQALDEAIERRLGLSAVRDIFSLGDPDALAALMRRVGFRQIGIVSASLTAQFGDPDQFLIAEIELDTAAIPAMQHLDAAARQDLVAALRHDLAEPLRAVTVNGRVEMPFETLIALANR